MKRKKLKSCQPANDYINSDSRYVAEAMLQEVDNEFILEIDIWDEKNIRGYRKMICRHFIDKNRKEYETLFTTDNGFKNKTYHVGDWSKSKLSTILSKGDWQYSYWRDRDVSMSSKTKEIIEHYLDNSGYSNVIYRIGSYEDEWNNNNANKKIMRKCDRINALMSQVKPITKDENFDRWLRTTVFPDRYIFKDARKMKYGYKCKCTTCGKTFYSKEQLKHNEIINCKKCGTQSIVKTRTSYVNEEKEVLVAQQFNDESWILRHFKFKAKSGTFFKETKMMILQVEKARMILKLHQPTKIYWGQDREYGSDEFKQEFWDKKCNSGIIIGHSFYMYPGNIENIDMPVNLKRMLITGANKGIELDYNQLIRCFDYHPYMEYLLKGRFYKLADEIIKNNGWWSRPESLLDITANNITDLLQINKQRACRLREMNGGKHALEFLQIEERDGIKFSQENLEFVEQYKLSEDSLEVKRTKININKAINYIIRQMKINNLSYTHLLQTYSDYLDMAQERGADITDDIIRCNSRMVEFHNKYLEEKNKEKDAKREKSLNRKFPNIAKDYLENKELFEWEDDNYVILAPSGAKDIIDEGRTLHHCVAASDTYFERMNKRESFILFLRNKETPEKPYYTLEISYENEDIRIKQKYAAYDRQPNIKAINTFIDKWKKAIKARRKQQKIAS